MCRVGVVTVDAWAHIMKRVLKLNLNWLDLVPVFATPNENHEIAYMDFLQTYRTHYKDV